MSSHGQIQAWIAVYRDIDAETQQRVDAHVATCETCAHVLAEYEYAGRALADLPVPAPDASLRDRFYRDIGWVDEGEQDKRRLRHLPTMLSITAAVVAIILLIGVLNVLLRGAPERMAQPGQSSTPTTEAWDSAGLILSVPPYHTGEIRLADARSDRSAGSVRPGQRLRLRLLWNYTGQEERPLSAFVHLTDFNDRLIAQAGQEILFSPGVPNKVTVHNLVVPDDPDETYYRC